jgi:uncharacterized protein
VVRPGDPTYAGAVGDPAGAAKCTNVGAEGQPMTVDWTATQRTDLEYAMAHGVAVVHYDCDTLKLLADCHVEGVYGFTGTAKQEEVISLENATEIQANLPLGGAQIGAKVASGSTLDVATIIVGKQMTTFYDVDRASLVGRCDGATHFVRGSWVGAFAMKTGTKGEVKAAVGIFGVGASGGDASGKSVGNKSGDVGACSQADVDSPRPPKECGSTVRIQLVAVADKVKPGLVVPAAQAASAGKTKTVGVVDIPTDALGCPAGLVAIGGKCGMAQAARPHTCAPSDAADCTAQCNAGDAGSCFNLGVLTATGGGGVARSKKKALGLYQTACDKGNLHGCTKLGYLYYEGEVADDTPNATALFTRTCNAGDAEGCTLLAEVITSYGAGSKAERLKNGPMAQRLRQRACDAGYGPACGDLADMYEFGTDGVTKSLPTAVSLRQRACDGGEGVECVGLGDMFKDGEEGTPVDLPRAFRAFVRGCSLGSSVSCDRVGHAYQSGKGAPTDAARAMAAYQSACDLESRTVEKNPASTGCRDLKALSDHK